MSYDCDDVAVVDQESHGESFQQDVSEGLRGDVKSLPCKYLYDERGSQLFDRICELDEYYLMRTELEIMDRYGSEMAKQIGTGVMLVEYGSGSSIKTRILLDHLIDPAAYVPVDISREHLQKSATALSAVYPDLCVIPVCADFTRPFELPNAPRTPTHSAVYFPGSTIGNFQPEAAQEILSQVADLCGTGGGLLIGIDLQKDASTLEAAYDDADGVTAEFNLNLLHRINREADGDFQIEQFEHVAFYEEHGGRIEIYLESRIDQTVTVAGELFEFAAGERIHTEHSHKYTIDGFASLAADVGLTLRRSWCDDQSRFAVLHLTVLD